MLAAKRANINVNLFPFFLLSYTMSDNLAMCLCFVEVNVKVLATSCFKVQHKMKGILHN